MLADKHALLEAINQPMPFGKYAGRKLLQLPEPYLVWFHTQGFPEGKLLSSAALVYLVPLLALFIGAMVGQAWLVPLLGGGELMTIISAVLFSGLGAITVKRYLQQNEQDVSHQVSLIRTLGESIELK